eukprot:12216837-Heterocapsa_arctica.AAC.1
MQISELSENINPFVLPETPAVLSVGDRTMNKGYSFIWPAYHNPYFITPNGYRVELEVIDDIPFLRRDSELSQPTRLRGFGPPRTPSRSRQASPAASVGDHLGDADGHASIGDSLEAPVADIIVEVPPPPVLDAEQEAQRVARRDLKTYAQSLSHMLTHKPANPYCDACCRGKMRDAKKMVGAFKASRNPT